MIAILDTGGANHASIQNALRRLERESIVTLDRAVIDQASHLILPGVGHAAYAMEKIRSAGLVDFVRAQTKPVLGICLGMQILFSSSEEGPAECLGVVSGAVKKLKVNGDFRVPHMGWNTLDSVQGRESSLLKDLDHKEYFYFVHSYAAPHVDEITHETVATGSAPAIPAILQTRNFFGAQFHPERSGPAGAQVLKNFLAIGVER